MKRKTKSVISCLFCSKEREVYNYRIKEGRGKYCSKICYYIARRNIHVSKETEFKTGHPFGKRIQKGQHLSPATEFKLIKGKPNCRDCGKQLKKYDATFCKKCVKKGERSHLFIDGTSYLKRNERLRIMDSIEYKQFRISVFQRDDYTCQICGVKNIILHLDHIKPWSLFPELRFDPDNCRTLCTDCHRKTDTYGGRIRKVFPNIYG